MTSALLTEYNDFESECERVTMLDTLLAGIAAKSGVIPSRQSAPRHAPTELLAIFKKDLIADETRVSFDYIGCSRRCMP